MKAQNIGVALVALLLLAACEDYGRVTQTQVDPGYSPDELGYAGGDKAILTTLIHGNPSDVAADRFAEQVLTSATLTAATLMAIDDKVGTLEPGKLGDIIAVPGDPLQDIEALSRVSFVAKGGIILKGGQ